MVAGEQLGWDSPAVPHFGPGVLGVFEKPVPMALLLEARRIGQHPGHQAAHRIRNRHGGDFPAGEDKIPQGNLFVYALVDEPLVDSLIVAAH